MTPHISRRPVVSALNDEMARGGLAFVDTLQAVISLNAQRRRLRFYSWVSLLTGVVVYLDAGWTYPIWLTGLTAFAVGTVFILVGFVCLISSYRLPIRETLLWASAHNGKITAPALSLGLEITLETAEQILDYLVKKGYAQVSTAEMEEGLIVYHIAGVQELSDGT